MTFRKTPPCILPFAFLASTCLAQDRSPQPKPKLGPGTVTLHSQGLHGYIGFEHEPLPADRHLGAGMGFYSAVWSLVDRPLANFQIGLPRRLDSAR